MILNFLKVSSYLLLLSVTVLSCGGKVKRENLGPERYFEYAKDLFDRGKHQKAVTEFTVIVLKFSANPIVDDAQYYLAESHFMLEEYLIAVAEYQKLISDYPESPFVEQSFYKLGLSYFNLSQRPELDQEFTQRAFRQFQNLIEAYSSSEYRDKAEGKLYELRIKLAAKQLLGANVYRKMGIFDSALIYYDILLEKYYDTPQAEKAMYWKAECLYRLKEYEDAITNFSAFIEKYPKSKFKKKAKSRISEIQEQIQSDEVSQSSFEKKRL
jgi:outer membrane protein assembly factor BamD